MLFARLINYFAAHVTIVLFTIALLTATVYYYKFIYKPFAKLPAWRLEWRIPYWILSRRKIANVFLEEAAKQGKKYETEGVFVVWFFKPILLVYGEEAIKSVMPYATCKPRSYQLLYEFLFGKAIFISNGARWKRQKKMLSPAFHVKALRMYASFMNNGAGNLVEKLWEKKGETVHHASQLMAESTLRLFYESTMGVTEVDSVEEGETITAMQKISEFALSRYFYPWLWPDSALRIFPSSRKIVELEEENRRTTIKNIELIRESMAARDQSQIIEEETDCLNRKPKTIGEILIKESQQDPSFSMEELAREVNFLILAGFDTTAHGLMWTFFCLGLHPEIQDRVYDEIATLQNEDIQYADAQGLTYLECVIKESLRMYTVVPFVARRLEKDAQCGKHLFAKDSVVIFFASQAHRNPVVYPNPDKFDPDRFMDQNSRIKPWNCIPFGEGPRVCIGKNYAMLSMKIFMCNVLRNFKVISLDRMEDVKLTFTMLLSAEKEPRLKFIPRHEKPRANVI